jgi:putative glutamine amidotransferase
VASTPYLKAVRRAGATPIILPILEPDDADCIDGLLAGVDGVVITGGGDVEPARYGAAAVHPQTYGVVPERDAADLALARTLVERDIPTLAICRGIQVLNVALGGTLDQHHPEHMQRDLYNETAHDVKIEAGSRLASIVDADTLGVNSMHHQTIDEPGDNVRVVARAADGTIESIEVDGAPHVLGVQWHPEMLRHRPEQCALFQSLFA